MVLSDPWEEGLANSRNSPFTPAFGTAPTSMVGRDRLIRSIASGFQERMGSPGHSPLVFGARGTGKTSLLRSIRESAAKSGWLTMSLDAGTPGLLERIDAAIEWAVRESGHQSLEDISPDSASRLNHLHVLGIGAGWEPKRHATNTDAYTVRERLAKLTKVVSDSGGRVLITLDEMHNIGLTEARRFCNDLQHISKGDELPLMFLGAGFPAMKEGILLDKRLSFFRRSDDYDIEAITVEDALKGIRDPIMQAGGTISDDALLVAAEGSAGKYPYMLQLVGDYAWKAARAPSGSIKARHAEQAVEAARRDFDEKISGPSWSDLSDAEQDYMSGLASLGGKAEIGQTKVASGLGARTANRVRRRLAVGGYVTLYREYVEIADLVPIESVNARSAKEEVFTPRAWNLSASDKPRCRKWMPRAQQPCVLAAGHKGACRSQI